MNVEFKKYFASCLSQFKAHGAERLRDELPELNRRAALPDASKAYLHFVADVCTELGHYLEAIGLLRIIETKFKLDDVGYNNLAFCLWETKSDLEAYVCYKKSLQFNSNNVSSLRGACFLAIEADHDQEAVEYCRKASQLLPENRELSIWFATALFNAGYHKELKTFVSKRAAKFGDDKELNQFLE